MQGHLIAPMTSPLTDEIVQRLEALEIKASFTEDLLDQLNLLMVVRLRELLPCPRSV